MKELGDVKNWAEIMEHDMRSVMSTLEFVHQGKKLRVFFCGCISKLINILGTIDGEPIENAV